MLKGHQVEAAVHETAQSQHSMSRSCLSKVSVWEKLRVQGRAEKRDGDGLWRASLAAKGNLHFLLRAVGNHGRV